jgi:pyruvate,water dikinase
VQLKLSNENPTDSSHELDCLFQLWKLFGERDKQLADLLRGIVDTIPQGMQYPEHCRIKVSVGEQVIASEGFSPTSTFYRVAVNAQDRTVGDIVVNYSEDVPVADDELFLRDECHMITAIADRLGRYLELETFLHESKERVADTGDRAWETLLDLLRRTDLELFLRLSHKIMIQLCLRNTAEARELLKEQGLHGQSLDQVAASGDEQQIRIRKAEMVAFGERVFEIAQRYLSGHDIFRVIQKWMHEEQCSSLVRAIANPESALHDINDVIRRLHQCKQEGVELSDSILRNARVQLIRRFLSEQLEFIRTAKDFVTADDFYEIIPRMIYLPDSRGKIGAKGAMLFLAAKIFERKAIYQALFRKIKFPRTWYLTTESLFGFICSNNLEDIMEQKYKPLDKVSKEYPVIVQFFKNSEFPPAMIRGISMALDDLGDVPLIVRSSSLLDDLPGVELRSQYHSRFLPNQGSKQARIDAVLGAIADLYASVFGPEPIEYRVQHGLLDFEEDMGILIQEVIGCRLGRYFLPTFSGVAYSREARRRASDEKSKDWTAAFALGLGSQVVNVANEAVVCFNLNDLGTTRHSVLDIEHRANTAKLEGLNLQTGFVESAAIQDFVKVYGKWCPGIEHCISRIHGNQLESISPATADFVKESWGVTFEGIIHNTDMVDQIRAMLDVLQDALRAPVEIEFASDGSSLFLLQCRKRGVTADRRASSSLTNDNGGQV